MALACKQVNNVISKFTPCQNNILKNVKSDYVLY